MLSLWRKNTQIAEQLHNIDIGRDTSFYCSLFGSTHGFHFRDFQSRLDIR